MKKEQKQNHYKFNIDLYIYTVEAKKKRIVITSRRRRRRDELWIM